MKLYGFKKENRHYSSFFYVAKSVLSTVHNNESDAEN